MAEARRLAGRLRRAGGRRARTRPEIVVLLRAFTHVAAVEKALEDAGLDPYVVGGRGFWSQQQIDDLRCLLAVIANPLDDEALFGALASPACARPARHALAAAAGRDRAGRRDGRELHQPHLAAASGSWSRTARSSRGDAEAAALIPAEELERLRALREHPRRAARALAPRAAWSRWSSERRPRFGYDLATLSRRRRRRSLGERPQADAARARVRGERGTRPRRLPRVPRRRARAAATARPRPPPAPRATPASG